MNGQCITRKNQIFQGIVSGMVILLWPSVSQAHLVNTGFGPFYDGISHSTMSPDELLTALALSLLAGLSGVRAGRNVLFLLPPVWIPGGVFGLQMAEEVSLPLVSVLSFLVTGVLVALVGQGLRCGSPVAGSRPLVC